MNIGVKGSRSDVTFLLVLLGISLTLNWFLGREWWGARRAAPTALEDIPLGQAVPPLHVKTLEGRPETIAYGTQTRPTVLYIFTPSCPWCRRNVINIKYLTATKESSYRFIGISLDENGVGTYIEEHGLTFPVYVAPAPESRSAYRMGSVPQTLVISPEGTIRKAWRGAYEEPNRSEIEKFFAVRLPGLPTAFDLRAPEDTVGSE